MSKKKNLLDRLYEYDSVYDAYKIVIALDKYEDIYDEWDGTPFRKRRDIEEEFVNYVKESSDDIPMKYNIDLELSMPLELKDEKKEKNAIAAIKSYFIYLVNKNKKIRINNILFSIRSFIMGIIFLCLCYIPGSFFVNSNVGKILVEGISIFGWVGIWDACENLVVYFSEINEARALKRLLRAKVEFLYK